MLLLYLPALYHSRVEHCQLHDNIVARVTKPQSGGQGQFVVIVTSSQCLSVAPKLSCSWCVFFIFLCL